DYWPAQGHFAYYRRLSNPGDCNGSRYIRFAARNRCFLVHRRYRLGHWAFLYCLWTTVYGATQVLYEGTPDTPHRGRWWEIVEKYGVTILYTAPTAIRSAMKWGRDIADRYDLSSIRLLGSVGEAINPEAWDWYREVIGDNNGAGTISEDGAVIPGPRKFEHVPIADTWWQTETGAHILTPLPALSA